MGFIPRDKGSMTEHEEVYYQLVGLVASLSADTRERVKHYSNQLEAWLEVEPDAASAAIALIGAKLAAKID